ncbi:MAG: hypothetical protein ACI92G_004470, partial [Candidatus Pelagisphaera sp.]
RTEPVLPTIENVGLWGSNINRGVNESSLF